MSASTILILTGGVGGAKLCLGMQRILPPGCLQLLVNTGDDFDHLGLRVCPDVDTTLYTLGGLANVDQGWGRQHESWSFMAALEKLGGETWFRLGDGDLAVHVERTRRLARGQSLSEITADFARRWEIPTSILPMSDDAVRTIVSTPEGDLSFQEYFVRRGCAPAINSLRFEGAANARIPPGVLSVLENPNLEAIVIAPSNPYLSIAPILAIPGLREALRGAAVPVVAVTPIIAGSAVKGPTAKVMRELGIEPTAIAIAEHYHGVIDGFVLDERDAHLSASMPVMSVTCDTLMRSLDDRDRVARSTLGLIESLKRLSV